MRKRKYLVAISPATPDRCSCCPCVAALGAAPATEEHFLSVRGALLCGGGSAPSIPALERPRSLLSLAVGHRHLCGGP